MKYTTIKEYPKYEISRCGSVRNVESKRIKSQYIGSTGYYMVSFNVEGNKNKSRRVHRLLAQTFIPNPDNHPFINHIDGDKLNNGLDNLEWCTHSHNMKHAFAIGLVNNTGTKNGMSKLNDVEVKEIKKLLAKGHSQHRIASMFGVSRSAILKIKLNLTWKDV